MKNRNRNIQIIRIVAMAMVVLCHVVQLFENKYLDMSAQFLNVGVYIFIFISGYLYSSKPIKSFFGWPIKKTIKLLIPVFILLIPISISNYIVGTFDFRQLIIHIFNLQGALGAFAGAGHLWFMTTIMYCYFLLPYIKMASAKTIRVKIGLIVAMISVAFVLNFFWVYLSRQLYYISIFSIGVLFAGELERFKANRANRIWFVLLLVVAIAVRVLGKICFDNSIVYDITITSLTHIAIAISIFQIINSIRMRNDTRTDAINLVDASTYYIYLIHYPLMVGPLSIVGKGNAVIGSICVVLISTIISFTIAGLLYMHRRGR